MSPFQAAECSTRTDSSNSESLLEHTSLLKVCLLRTTVCVEEPSPGSLSGTLGPSPRFPEAEIEALAEARCLALACLAAWVCRRTCQVKSSQVNTILLQTPIDTQKTY